MTRSLIPTILIMAMIAIMPPKPAQAGDQIDPGAAAFVAALAAIGIIAITSSSKRTEKVVVPAPPPRDHHHGDRHRDGDDWNWRDERRTDHEYLTLHQRGYSNVTVEVHSVRRNGNRYDFVWRRDLPERLKCTGATHVKIVNSDTGRPQNACLVRR